LLYLRRREDVSNSGNSGKSKMNPMSIYIIRREIQRWFRIWSQKFIFAYAFKRKSRFKKFAWANQKNLMRIEFALNFNSKYVHMLILALSATLESPTFKKTTFRNNVTLRNRLVIKLSSSILWNMLHQMS